MNWRKSYDLIFLSSRISAAFFRETSDTEAATSSLSSRYGEWRLIDRLEFLIALARERHFGRAADVCGVSQPTLSSGLKQLEESLNTLLVVRGSRFEGFTVEGERALEWARRIVSDSRAMRQELDALKRGLTGEIKIAAIPTALPMVSGLTTPYRANHPNVSFTILSRTSIDVLKQIENLEVDAGLTYIDNEPLGRMSSVPLYREEYRFLTAADAPLGDRETVTWAEVGKVPLCLLTADMQNRRIIDQVLRSVGIETAPTLQSNSMVVLHSHVRTGRWASIMPAVLADNLGLTPAVRSIPIVEPVIGHTIGLVAPEREPMTPLVAALLTEGKKLAKTLLAS